MTEASIIKSIKVENKTWLGHQPLEENPCLKACKHKTLFGAQGLLIPESPAFRHGEYVK